MSISMALFSPPTHPPSLSRSIPPNSKPHINLKPHLSLSPLKNPVFLLSTVRASSDNEVGASASAATAPEPEADQKVPEPPHPMAEKDESSAGTNGFSGAAEAGEVAVVSKYGDTRWIGGTWDLKQFEKDGKTDWDAVIDAAVTGVLVIRKNEDIENLKKLVEETTFYDKQWQATWQDETPGSSKN